MVNVGQQVGRSIGTSLLNTLAASAIAAYAATHALSPQSATLGVLHGYYVGFTWSVAILLAAAIPAAGTESPATEVPGSARSPAACGLRG